MEIPMNNLKKRIVELAPSTQIGLVLYYELKKKWPQINDETELMKASWHCVELLRPQVWSPMPIQQVWANRKGKKARFWRWLGVRLGRTPVMRKGQYLKYADPTPMIKDTLTVVLQGLIIESLKIYVGYCPELDTLCYKKDSQ